MQVRALVVSVFVALPGSLLAQDTSTPFHAGQWGAQFAGGFSFASLGVIKFRSPTSATVLDLRVSGAHRELFVNDTLFGIDSFASISLRLGRRWYRPVAEKVVALNSVGIIAGFDHSVTSTPFAGRSVGNGWSGGPFADLGGVYLITPHVGIGVTATASINYSRSSGESPTGVKSRTWTLGGNTAISFAATIYF